MQSKAKTVKEYLSSLPVEKRKDIELVRKTILKALPKGYKEIMQYGMIGYVVPLTTYPKGYLDKKTPLPYVCLAAQKNYIALYLLSVYSIPGELKWFQKAYKESGKKLDMGKSCVRFKKASDVPLDVIAEAVSRVPVKKAIAVYEANRKS